MKGEEKKLLGLFERLEPQQQDKLIAFAEFLTGGAPGEAAASEPLAIPRPAGETVTKAIRRLTRTYPMLDRKQLMGEASRFMAQHALEGRAAREVIDDLEAVFARHYQREKEKGKRGKGNMIKGPARLRRKHFPLFPFHFSL